jgi:hypothetical protein
MKTTDEQSDLLARYIAFRAGMAETHDAIRTIRDESLRQWEGLAALERQADKACSRVGTRCQDPQA